MNNEKMKNDFEKNFLKKIKNISLKDIVYKVDKKDYVLGRVSYKIKRYKKIEDKVEKKIVGNELVLEYVFFDDVSRFFYVGTIKQSITFLNKLASMQKSCWIEAYVKWMNCEFQRLKKGRFEDSIEDTDKCLEFIRESAGIICRRKIEQLLNIDIELISGISSISYERCYSEAAMCFLHDKIEEHDIILPLDVDEREKSTFLLDKNNIRLHRKLLQMVRHGQCLLYEYKAYQWEAVGIVDVKNVLHKGLIVRMKGQMYWSIELKGKKILRYLRGRYDITEEYQALNYFRIGYKKVFEKQVPNQVNAIVKSAFQMRCGLVLIFVEKDDKKVNCGAVGLCKKDISKLSKKQLENMAAIDGSIMLNEDGEVLKYGMILNSTEQAAGTVARGSRYNSVKNYIEACRKKSNRAIGIVISEDRILNIIDTLGNVSREINL